MSDLPFGEPLTAANPAAPAPRKCKRHEWTWIGETPEDGERCRHCPAIRDVIGERRGKNNRTRGLSIQRQTAAALGMEHIPGNGPADARDGGFYAEIKSGPSWYSLRVEAELDNLPTDTGRAPIFVAASTPGAGRSRRVYVTVGLGDLVRMVGPHAQVSMWAPQWVVLKGKRLPEPVPAAVVGEECLAQRREPEEWDYVCTRPSGHEGPHVAHGYTDEGQPPEELSRWVAP